VRDDGATKRPRSLGLFGYRRLRAVVAGWQRVFRWRGWRRARWVTAVRREPGSEALSGRRKRQSRAGTPLVAHPCKPLNTRTPPRGGWPFGQRARGGPTAGRGCRGRRVRAGRRHRGPRRCAGAHPSGPRDHGAPTFVGAIRGSVVPEPWCLIQVDTFRRVNWWGGGRKMVFGEWIRRNGTRAMGVPCRCPRPACRRRGPRPAGRTDCSPHTTAERGGAASTLACPNPISARANSLTEGGQRTRRARNQSWHLRRDRAVCRPVVRRSGVLAAQRLPYLNRRGMIYFIVSATRSLSSAESP
jgi:hypothetical protein